MNQIQKLQDTLKSLRLGEAAEYLPFLLEKSESNDTYATFLMEIMNYEQKRREEKR